MSTEARYKLLLGIILVCVLGLGTQSIYLWQMNQKLTSLQGDQAAIPESIEARLADSLQDNDPLQHAVDPDYWFGQALTSDPFARLQQMQEQMDSFFNSPGISPFGGVNFSTASPVLSLNETDAEYLVRIQTPPDHDVEIDTELEANLLTVTGTLTRDMSNNSKSFSSNISSRSQFTRSFDLPKPVDELGVYTEQEEGGLSIHVPKK